VMCLIVSRGGGWTGGPASGPPLIPPGGGRGGIAGFSLLLCFTTKLWSFVWFIMKKWFWF